jgi:hypothetical protein
MKKLVPALCVVALAASLGFPQDPAPQGQGSPNLEKRVEALEKELAATKQELADTRARVDASVAYLHAQAKGAQHMLDVLASSEEAGFVPGINYRSREILLSGMREWYGGKTEDLPAAKPTAPAKKSPAPAPAARDDGGR